MFDCMGTIGYWGPCTGTPKRRGFDVFGYMARLAAMPLPAATNTDGAAAKAADLARTEAESPFYTTKQGRAGAGHLLIDFRLHGKHWVLGGLYRSTVGFFFANENRRAKTHATTENIYSSTSGYDPQRFSVMYRAGCLRCDVPWWPGLLTRIVSGALLGRTILL